MARLWVSVPTRILAPLTARFRRRVAQRTLRTPLRATSAAAAIAISFHPRALLLGGEDPAHDLAGLDQPLRAPGLPVAEEARGGLVGGDGVDLGLDAREALLPERHVLFPDVHPPRMGPRLDRLGRDLERLLRAGGRGDLALRPPQEGALREEDGDADGDDLAPVLVLRPHLVEGALGHLGGRDVPDDAHRAERA